MASSYKNTNSIIAAAGTSGTFTMSTNGPTFTFSTNSTNSTTASVYSVTSSFANSGNAALPNFFSKPTPDQKDKEIEKLRKTVRDLKDQQKATEELFLRAMKMLNRVAQSPGHGLSTKAAKVAHALREEFGELKESIYPYMWF